MQQEAVQAMLVACISYYDESIPRSENTLLRDNCANFMKELGAAIPSLLKAAGAANQPQGQLKQTATPTKRVQNGTKSPSASTVAVKDLQQVLRQDGDYQGPINGVYSAEIQDAYVRYLAKHPSGLVQSAAPAQGQPPTAGQAPVKPSQ
jgi:hypothetical protein